MSHNNFEYSSINSINNGDNKNKIYIVDDKEEEQKNEENLEEKAEQTDLPPQQEEKNDDDIFMTQQKPKENTKEKPKENPKEKPKEKTKENSKDNPNIIINGNNKAEIIPENKDNIYEKNEIKNIIIKENELKEENK